MCIYIKAKVGVLQADLLHGDLGTQIPSSWGSTQRIWGPWGPRVLCFHLAHPLLFQPFSLERTSISCAHIPVGEVVKGPT